MKLQQLVEMKRQKKIRLVKMYCYALSKYAQYKDETSYNQLQSLKKEIENGK